MELLNGASEIGQQLVPSADVSLGIYILVVPSADPREEKDERLDVFPCSLSLLKKSETHNSVH